MSRLTTLLLLVGACLGTAGFLMAQVVPPTTVFELDGNSVLNGLHDDWNLLNGTGGPTSVPPGNGGLPGSSVARTFLSEPAGGAVFTGGSTKDPIDVSSWHWKTGATPDKDFLTNGYAALYSVNGHTIIMFGADRFATNGDSNIGIWFFQDNVGPLPNGNFGPGMHKPGDIFVLSAFTIGGTQPGISVYKWNPLCTGAAKNPAPGPIPGSCADSNLEVVFASSNVCDGAAACAQVNGIGTPNADAAGAITVTWPYASKFGGATNVIPAGGFYEGGVDITSLLGPNFSCFTHVIFETRSSQATGSVLKDFIAGNLNFCGSIAINKTCENAAKYEGSPDVIRYAFDGTVRNTGPVDLLNVKVTDTYPSGAFTISNKVLQCGGSLNGTNACTGGVAGVLNPDGTMSCTFAGSLPVTGSLGYCGSFDSDTKLASNITNHADVVAAQNVGGPQNVDNDLGTGDWPAACAINFVPELDITKTCNTTIDQNVGGHIVIGVTFSGTVCNHGPVDVSGITATDSFAGALTLSSTTLEPNTCANFGPVHVQPATCNAGSDGRCAISNTVNASGTGAFASGPVSAPPMAATCRVCPSGSCSTSAP